MNPRVEQLLAEFVERREAGEVLAVEEFLARHEDQREHLRDALLELDALEDLFPEVEELGGVPSRVGPYRVLSRLGHGGMGRVFRVVHEREPSRPLALKQLHPLVAMTPRARERFRREGELLAQLDHPGIVRVVDVQADSVPPYIVMELVDGRSLADYLAEARERNSKGVPIDDALELPGQGAGHELAARLIARASLAVAELHDRGLLHRDLKPSNLIVLRDGNPVLIDFGLAVHDESETLTASGDLLGTPHYMAPEQARGERAEARTDVYGLGAILYELLTLRTPHPGQDPFEVLRHIARSPVASIARRNRAVPKPLERIVRRAMSWRRERRFASAGALAQDLQRLLEGQPVRARATGPIELLDDLLRCHPRMAVGAGAALLVAALVAVGWIHLRGDEGAERGAAIRAGSLAWLAGDKQALLEAASRLEELDSSSPKARLLAAQALGEVLAPTGDAATDAVSTGLRRLAAGDAAAAASHFETATETEPGWVLPLALLGRAAAAGGEERRAERELRAASRLLPESAQLALELARLQVDAEQYGPAQRVLRRTLKHHPGSWELWYRLAKAHALARENEVALDAVLKAMEFSPQPRTEVLNLYAATVDRLGDHEPARRMIRDLIAKHPERAALHFNLAYSLDLECKLVEARAAYREAVRLNPGDLKALAALAHMAAGSKRESCARCQAAFAERPDLYDPAEAERLALVAIEKDGCETSWLADFAVGIGMRVGRNELIEAALRNQIDDHDVDERVVRVERALRRIERDGDQ